MYYMTFTDNLLIAALVAVSLRIIWILFGILFKKGRKHENE
jgi:hypothetical protein